MRAAVRTVWPTFVGDAGKPRIFLVVWPGEHVPDYGQARNCRHFTTRAAAQAHADQLNGVRSNDWIAS